MQGREITFKFMNGEVLGPNGPCVSDDLITWDFCGGAVLNGRSEFTYRFSENEERKYFSFSMPYQVSHFESFMKTHEHNPLLRREILGKSEQNRDIPLAVIGNPDAPNFYLTCRYHACESPASYALEGVMDFLLTKPTPLTDQFCFRILPFADIDGVENGDQGKSRYPHDHSLDYSPKPIYTLTKLLMEYVKEHPPHIMIDNHSPGKWGRWHDWLVIVEGDEWIKEQQHAFGRVMCAVTAENPVLGHIPFRLEDILPRGTDWNDPAIQTERSRMNSDRDFFRANGAEFVSIFEVPYFGTEGIVYTPRRLRSLGHDMAKAYTLYFCK
jgi:hypothetical protein